MNAPDRIARRRELITNRLALTPSTCGDLATDLGAPFYEVLATLDTLSRDGTVTGQLGGVWHVPPA